MEEERFVGVAREVARRALQGVSDIVYRRSIEELLDSDASYLTGMDVSGGVLREMDSWRRVETYREFREYLRGGVERWDSRPLIGEVSKSLSKALTMTIYFSIMDLIGGGCWSSGECGGVDRALADSALDISMSFRKRSWPGSITWLTLAKRSLFYPTSCFVANIKDFLQVEGWKRSDGYAEGLKRLAGLLFWTVVCDAWFRERAAPEDVAKWHYDNDVRERRAQYEALDWSDIIDDYAPYSRLIQLSFKSLEEVVLEEGLHAWRARIDSESLASHARQMQHELLKSLDQSTRENYKKYDDAVSEILSGRGRGVATQLKLKRIAGLWGGWVGSMYRGVAEYSVEGEVLHLLVKEPIPRLYPFDGRAFIFLTTISLGINRQATHIYSHIGKLFAEKAEREGLGEIARSIDRGLAPLYSKRRGWAGGELQRFPPRPLPSIYEQVLHTQTVAVGMAYGVLSRMSLALKLDPEIPLDPLGLVELVPVKEEWGKEWSELTRPEFSRSLDLLRASARLPIGHLERQYDYIERALKLLPLPMNGSVEAEES
jgi:hypothetical protein